MGRAQATLVGAAYLFAAVSLGACTRTSEGPSRDKDTVVGDDVKGVAKATEKTAKDIGHAAVDLGDKARKNLEGATDKAGDSSQDAWLTTKVKGELTRAGLDPLHVHVDTDAKIVTLSGVVESAADAHKAVAAAKGVQGVASVQDHLSVKPAAR